MPQFSSLLPDLLHLIKQAGNKLAEFYQQSVEVKLKADHTPVTEADLFLSNFLTTELQKLTPSLPVLSEENCQVPLAQRKQWEAFWLIDPLDGTQQFINRTDQFAIVISLVVNHRPEIGLIHAPILGKTYCAVRGEGAFLQEQDKTVRLSSNKNKELHNHHLDITVGLSKHDEIFATILPPYSATLHSYGSSSLKAGLIAEGKADCYVRFGDTGEWDTAAAEVLLAETGGAIFDRHFQPLSYNQRETLTNPHFVMVANQGIDWQKVFKMA